MITKFKIFENIVTYDKPKKGDDDYVYQWGEWSKEELNKEFGDSIQGGNANWGGMRIWPLGDSDWSGWFIVDLEDDSFSLTFRDENEDDEYDEDYDPTIFTANAEEDNLEELIELARIKKKSSDFNL